MLTDQKLEFEDINLCGKLGIVLFLYLFDIVSSESFPSFTEMSEPRVVRFAEGSVRAD